MKLLDLRTLPCPHPVIECRKALEEQNIPQLQVLVDNDAAVINVSRYLEQQGYTVENNKQDNDFIILAHLDSDQIPIPSHVTNTSYDAENKNILIFITTNTLGRGDEDLGQKLMNTFLGTLPELGNSLWRVILLNGGVKLAAENGPALESLQALEKTGINILVCGTCLAHYKLEKQVGETSNMLDIVTSLQIADQVIRP